MGEGLSGAAAHSKRPKLPNVEAVGDLLDVGSAVEGRFSLDVMDRPALAACTGQRERSLSSHEASSGTAERGVGGKARPLNEGLMPVSKEDGTVDVEKDKPRRREELLAALLGGGLTGVAGVSGGLGGSPPLDTALLPFASMPRVRVGLGCGASDCVLALA